MQLEWVFKYAVYSGISARGLTGLRIIHARYKLLMATDKVENNVICVN